MPPSTQTKTNPNPGVGREERSSRHLLLRGQGVQGVQGGRGVQAVRGCHLGQGGLRVPAAGEARMVSTGPGPRPPAVPRSQSTPHLTLGPRGPVSPLGPFEVGRERENTKKDLG